MEQNVINKDDYLNFLNEEQGFWEFVRERLDYYELEENTDDILSLADDIRYIFKEVFESLPVEQIHYGEWLPVDDKNDAFDCLAEEKEVKPVRPLKVKTGHWVWNPNGQDWGIGAWECSECGGLNLNIGWSEKIGPLQWMGSKFCPNCGVKMTKG